MITFNNIVERFKVFADAHFFVKSFSFGSPDDVDLSKFTNFPLMHLVYTGATYDAGTKTYNLEVYILDVPADKTKKTDRQKEVVSDAEQCAEDIIADIKNGGNIFLFAQDYEVVNATTTPLEEETKNVLSGVLLDLSVGIPYEWDACNAPIDGVSPEGGDEVAYARRGILRMLTEDGSTDVLSVRTIKVTNGTLTDDGDGVVTLDTGGASTLDELDDVEVPNPSAGQSIMWDSGSGGRWVKDSRTTALFDEFKQGLETTVKNGAGTDSELKLEQTKATVQTGITKVVLTETSPGDIEFVVATDANGDTAFTALHLDGSSTANVADLLVKFGTYFKLEDGNFTQWIRPSSGATQNTTITLPNKSGVLGREEDIPTSVTNLNDVTSAGSGAIITDAERTNLTTNTAKVGLIAGGTTGQALVKSTGTDYDVEWADIAVDVQYHQRYDTEAAALRSGATETVELYYTAQADGDGLSESASSDTPTSGYDIRRKLYYAEKAQADPDTSADWTQFTAIADNTTFANAKAALLAYLKERTGGTVPISLKMTWEEVAQAPAFTGLLNETYGSGAAAAYSVRRLNGNYTGAAIEVERSSDNTTQDIGFDSNGDLDESALTTFCTGTTCKVRTWYDQSVTGGTGSGNDAVQTVHANQPTIYTGGAIVKDNGRVAFSGSSDFLEASSISSGSEDRSVYIVYHADTVSNTNQMFDFSDSSSSAVGSVYTVTTEVGVRCRNTTYVPNGGNTDRNLLSIEQDISESPELHMYLSGTETGSGGNISENVIAGATRIMGSGQTNTYDGLFQEILIYAGVNGDKSTDRTSIESNIGDYFTQNTPLLDTYSGAAAAYSLRLLDSTYSGSAIRVRRASDNAESDIGFNVFGELSTVELAAFCGSSDGFVKTWYSQAGTGVDATQSTTANQPKIYDGTTGVVTENGKPAVEFDGSNDSVHSAQITMINQPLTYAAVAKLDTTGGTRFIYDSYTGILSRSWSGGGFWRISSDTTLTGAATNTNQNLLFNIHNSTSSSQHVNGSLAATGDVGTDGTDGFTIGNYPQGSFYFDGKVQELICWSSNESANRTAIESNINTFYSIY